MDSSKRQFLQQLGVLTAGASLVPLAEAKFPFSPERHEGSPDTATPCLSTCGVVSAVSPVP